jgi:hypothetical protein
MNLEGIDGGQFFGFMTALGTLALLDSDTSAPEARRPRLHFERGGVPVLSEAPVSPDLLAEAILRGLQEYRTLLNTELRDLKKPGDLSHDKIAQVARNGNRTTLNFLAGLGCVIGTDTVESTLCAANGASHQNLIQSMRDILALIGEQEIKDALFVPWRRAYRVPDTARQQLNLGTRKPTLRLDPADERLYALRASNPTTTDDFATELGAQALAIPAFGVLPVVPRRHPVAVSSKRGRRGRVFFSWPLWGRPASLASARSLIFSGVGDQERLRLRGVFAAFRVARVSGDKGKLSFTPTEGLW